MNPTLELTPPDEGFESRPYLGQILLLAAAQAILMLGYGAVLPILPYYLIEFGAGAFEYGLLVATFSIFAFIAAGPLGTLSDRIGRKPVILISLAGAGLSLFVFSLSNSLLLLFVTRAAEGFFTAGLWPSGDALVSDIVPARKRGSAWGNLLAGRTTGMIFGPTIGGILAFYLGVRIPFMICAALAFIALLLSALFIREPPRTRSEEEILHDHSRQSWLDRFYLALKAYWNVLLTGGLLLVVAMIVRFTRILSIATVEPIFAIYTTDPRTFGLTPIELGLFFFCFAITNAISQLGFGRLADRIGHGSPMVLSGFVTAFGLFLAIIATTTLQLYLVAVFLGLGGAMALPSTAAVAAESAPPTERGRAMGLLSMSGSLGRATGPISGGFLYASILALTDNPYLAALPPVTIALIVGILGSLAAIPLFLRARRNTMNKKLGEEKPLKTVEG
ncbi:MAG: MFS transporter [Promethearchaeota archaeon]